MNLVLFIFPRWQVTSLCVPLPKHGGWGGSGGGSGGASGLTAVGGDGPSGPLRHLTAEDLSRFPRLTVLDVSHHSLTHLRGAFTTAMPIVELDVSHNSLRSLGACV